MPAVPAGDGTYSVETAAFRGTGLAIGSIVNVTASLTGYQNVTQTGTYSRSQFICDFQAYNTLIGGSGLQRPGEMFRIVDEDKMIRQRRFEARHAGDLTLGGSIPTAFAQGCRWDSSPGRAAGICHFPIQEQIYAVCLL